MNNFKGKYGPLLIAEIGGNHEGDFSYAKKLTALAIESGVDYVKFQLYSGDSLVSKIESEQRNAHFKKFELTKDQHIELAEMCFAGGVKYMASVWNLDFIQWIDRYITIYKIGSGDLTAFPILKQFALLGKPLIISTGLATMEEVLASVSYIQQINSLYKSADQLAILQCTSMYPISFSDANLNVMQSLKSATGLTVGYSDHAEGLTALEVAAAMGAKILEFHFTDERVGKTFRDHKVSLTRDEVKSLIERLQNIEILKGSHLKQPVNSEILNGHVTSFRRAVYLNKSLKAGDLITESDLVVLRPNHGIDARDFDKLPGKVLLQNVDAYHKLEWSMLT